MHHPARLAHPVFGGPSNGVDKPLGGLRVVAVKVLRPDTTATRSQ